MTFKSGSNVIKQMALCKQPILSLKLAKLKRILPHNLLRRNVLIKTYPFKMKRLLKIKCNLILN